MGEEINPFASPQAASTPAYADAAPGRSKWMRPYVSPHARATVAIIMLAFCLLAKVLFGGSTYMQIELLERARAGQVFSIAVGESNDRRQQAAAILVVVVHLASAVAFLTWFYRAHANLHALGALNLKNSPGWAIGGWFVPFLCLVTPYQVMSEIWKGSAPRNYEDRAFSIACARGSPLVGLWWASFLIMAVAGRLPARNPGSPQGIDAAIAASWMVLFTCVVSVPAALVAIWLVRSIDRNQEKRHQLVLRAEAETPPASESFASDAPEWLLRGELP
jgi:hypothetical protein